MRTYKIDGLESLETLKTLPQEITVQDFLLMLQAQTAHIGDINYYLAVFSILGLSEEYLDIMDSTTLFTTIKDFQNDFVVSKEGMVTHIELNGIKYTAIPGISSGNIPARMMADIEERMTQHPDTWITYALARIFLKDVAIMGEHKDKKHIKNKEKSMAHLTMDIALPYIHYISSTYVDNIKVLMTLENNE